MTERIHHQIKQYRTKIKKGAAGILLFVCLCMICLMCFVPAPGTASFAAAPTSGGTSMSVKPVKPLSDAAFVRKRILMDQNKCKATARSVILEWNEIPGAVEYQIVRSAALDGDYEDFAVTEENRLKKKADGEYYYKVRASNGKTCTSWSDSVHIFSLNGVIQSMSCDDRGDTHFRIHLQNRSGRSAYFYGPGLSSGYHSALCRVYKYQILRETVVKDDGEMEVVETRQRIKQHPYPMTAQPVLPMYRVQELAPGEEGMDLDLVVHSRLTPFGETGIADDSHGYEIELTAFPDKVMPAFALKVAGEDRLSACRGRIER